MYEISIMKRKKYHLIYQYYQPTFPSFTIDVKITTRNGISLSSTKVKTDHCVAKAGCRESHLVDNYLEGDLTISFEIPKAKELWLVSCLLLKMFHFCNIVLVNCILILTALTLSQYQAHLSAGVGQLSVPNFEKGGLGNK